MGQYLSAPVTTKVRPSHACPAGALKGGTWPALAGQPAGQLGILGSGRGLGWPGLATIRCPRRCPRRACSCSLGLPAPVGSRLAVAVPVAGGWAEGSAGTGARRRRRKFALWTTQSVQGTRRWRRVVPAAAERCCSLPPSVQETSEGYHEALGYGLAAMQGWRVSMCVAGPGRRDVPL